MEIRPKLLCASEVVNLRIRNWVWGLLKRVVADLEEIANVEQMPGMEGRQMVMVLGPKKTNK